MTNIIIREEDLTNPQAQTINENVVYIPGAATTGPLNTPVLITTLNDFHKVFGASAYKYASSFTDIYGNGTKSGETEKSYIYAEEVLNAGLPILYERLGNGTKATDSAENVCAKYEGDYANNLSYTISASSNKNYLTVFAGTEVIEKKEVSFDSTNPDYVGKVNFNTITILKPSELSVTESAIELSNGTYTFALSDIANLFKTDTVSKTMPIEKIADRYEYDNLSFITTGGYSILDVSTTTTNSLVVELLQVAGKRGDVVAIVNSSNTLNPIDTQVALKGLNITDKNALGESITIYGTSFTTNYGSFDTVNYGTQLLPSSLGYLIAFGNSIKSNAVWIPVANTTRGLISTLKSVDESKKVTGAVMQNIVTDDTLSINPILYVRPYGYCVYGNRTLYSNELGLADSCYLNIRILVNTIKKALFKAAQKFTFDINDDILWLRFKSEIEPLLDRMKSDRGIRSYSSEKLESNKKGQLKCKFSISPIEGVEEFDITVSLTDTVVEVE